MPRCVRRSAPSSIAASITLSGQQKTAPEAASARWPLQLGALAAVSQHGVQGLERLLNGLGDVLQGVLGGAQDPRRAASSAAAGLKAGLAAESVASALPLRELVLGGALGLAAAIQLQLAPQGPGGCDHNPLERCANCVTSVPYVVVGAHALANRRTAAGRTWGASMCAVGLASVNFHASTGRWRTLGRRLDYWSIAAASNILTRAVYRDVPPLVTVAGMALTPFKPFLVSFLNSSAMELRFLQRAMANPQLRPAQRLHAATCLLGLGAFALEEACPQLPLVHAAWHCLSATAVASVNHLLADVERLDGEQCGVLASRTSSMTTQKASLYLPPGSRVTGNGSRFAALA